MVTFPAITSVVPWYLGFDLDGVILHPSSQRPITGAVDVLNGLFDSGHRIIIATARPWILWWTIEPLLNHYGIPRHALYKVGSLGDTVRRKAAVLRLEKAAVYVDNKRTTIFRLQREFQIPSILFTSWQDIAVMFGLREEW